MNKQTEIVFHIRLHNKCLDEGLIKEKKKYFVQHKILKDYQNLKFNNLNPFQIKTIYATTIYTPKTRKIISFGLRAIITT